MKRWTSRMLLWCLLIAVGFYAAGCNTVRGIGRDLKTAGDAIEDAAR